MFRIVFVYSLFYIHKTFISALWAAKGAISTPMPQLFQNININLMFEDEDEEEDCDDPLFSPVLLFPAFAHYKVTNVERYYSYRLPYCLKVHA